MFLIFCRTFLKLMFFVYKVMLRALDTLKVAHTLDAHSGTLSDFDASGHTLITCGFSQRPG